MEISWNRLLWEMRRLTRRFGWGVCTGAMLGMGSCLFAVAAVQVAQQRVSTEREISVLRAAQASRVEISKPLLEEDRLSKLYSILPGRDKVHEELQRISDIAERNGLKVLEAEYRLTLVKGTNLAKYKISMPLKADYPSIQRFIAELLQESSAVALEGIDFRREKIESRDLEARLQLAIFVRDDEKDA